MVWENGYSQVLDSPTRADDLLDVYLLRPEISVTSSGIVQGVSDHNALMLEVEWEETCSEPQVERVVTVYNKTNVSALQNFLRDKFVIWASNGSSVGEIWYNFKNIVYESVEYFVPHKIVRKNSDPYYYSKEFKRLISKVRNSHNRRKLLVHCTENLKQVSKKLFAGK